MYGRNIRHGVMITLSTFPLNYLILGGMFKVDPRERPNINEVVARLQEIAVARNVNLKAPLNISEVIPNSGKKLSIYAF